MSRGALLLLPNLLAETKYPELYLPASVFRAVESVKGLIAESDPGGRRYLGLFLPPEKVRITPIAVVDGRTSAADFDFYLEPILSGEHWGYVSDSGLPCLADPGAKLVARARQCGIAVKAFVGPSSITLGLMLVGLPAQRFAFHGYLPRDEEARSRSIRLLQERSYGDDATQVCIEAPQRNDALLASLLATLKASTLVAVAWDLTAPNQGVISQSVDVWRRSTLPNLQGKPAIFYLYAGK